MDNDHQKKDLVRMTLTIIAVAMIVVVVVADDDDNVKNKDLLKNRYYWMYYSSFVDDRLRRDGDRMGERRGGIEVKLRKHDLWRSIIVLYEHHDESFDIYKEPNKKKQNKR